jgi:AraC-like DNA-binding protein
MAEDPNPARFDIIGHLTVLADTLRQSLETVIRFSRIVCESHAPLLHEEGDTAILTVGFGLECTSAASVRFSAELAMSGLVRLLRRFVGASAAPRRVSFTYEAPSYCAEYARCFGGRERFRQSFFGIEFERAWLDHTQLYKNATLYEAMRVQAERALGRLARDAALAERVKTQLHGSDPACMPTMDEVARQLGMSERSLRRRLAQDGVVYRELVESALAHAAKRLLERPTGSIQEAAYAMGFAQPGAFHRAFKRWTGMTPKEYMSSF